MLNRRLLAALVVSALAVIGVGAAWAAFNREPSEPVTLAAPAPGEVRPDYLPDGEPVFVVGHEDGSVQAISAFSSHAPQGLLKLVWWCPSARGFEDPFHGARWNANGAYIFGPALGGLPSWEVTPTDNTLTLGDLQEPPPDEAPPIGDVPDERAWCVGPDEATYHTFDDWQVWDSPSAVVTFSA